tara:strand:+ start:500 stop:4270 length:3771 start_codon:yes stop_codon:yes gene_type:complete
MAESKKQDISVPFPVRGIQEVGSHSSQPPQSTADAKNVVPFDAPEDRMRGGRRRAVTAVSGGSIGGKVQLLDDMKVPKSDYQGFAGGTIPYSGQSDGVSQGITSNLSNIVIDPNQDGNTVDSMDGQGALAYQGPGNGNTVLPVDMYESSVIWPTPDAFHEYSNASGAPDVADAPLAGYQITQEDLDAAAADIHRDGTDRSTLPLITDGGTIAIDGHEGLWRSKTVDDLTGVIYPRPPYDTDGSTRNPGASTKPSEQPNSDSQPFFYGGSRNANRNVGANYMAGKHVSTVLFPASDSTDVPYNSIEDSSGSWCMQGSIKTPAATPSMVYYGGNNDTGWSGVKLEEGNPKLGLKLVLDTSVALPNASVPSGYTVWSYAGYWRVQTPSGSQFNVYPPSREVACVRGRFTGIYATAENHSARSVAERFYGFVFRVKASVDTDNNTIDISADSDEDRYLFVGFHDPPKSSTSSLLSHKTPRLIIGKGVTKVKEGDTVNGVASPLLDDGFAGDAGLDSIYEASGSGENENMPELGHGEWHDLQVRVHENTLTVYLDGIGPIKFTQNGDDTVSKIDLVDYLGANTDGGTYSLSRARSGLAYFSTRMQEPIRSFQPSGKFYGATALTGTVSYGEGWHAFDTDSQTSEWYGNKNLNGFNGSGEYMSNKLSVPLSASYAFSGGSLTCNGNLSYLLYRDPDYDNKYIEPPGGSWDSNQAKNDPLPNPISRTPEEMADRGHYNHNWGGLWALQDEAFSAATNHGYLVDVAGYGGDWVREWAPAYFHNVRWRSFTEQGSAGSNKLAIAVAGGKIVVSGDDGASFSGLDDGTEGSGTFPANVQRVGGTVMFDRYYLADGSKYLVIDTPLRKILNWSDMTLEDGVYHIPGGANSADTPKCRLICSWLGRIAMAGKADEPNNWFLSEVSETEAYENNQGPNNWNFDGTDIDGGLQPIAGNSSNMPELGDPITSLFPYHETNLVFGCTNSIYVLTGDPGPSDTTATIQTVSRDIGIVSPDAWCHGPNRSLYFFGQNGLYQMAPNEFNVDQSNRISAGRLDKTFASIDASLYHVSLCYDYHTYGVHVFLHARDQPQSLTGTHYYYDERSDSLWPMEYPSDIGPSYAIAYNNLDPDRRRILLGGYDGVIRHFNSMATADNHVTPIDSYVWIGPIFLDDVTETKLMRIASVLDKTPVAQTDAVTYEIYVGDTVEEAKASSPVITGTWNSGRNPWRYTRARGQSIFVKLSSNVAAVPWAIETITATIAVAGRARDRS